MCVTGEPCESNNIVSLGCRAASVSANALALASCILRDSNVPQQKSSVSGTADLVYDALTIAVDLDCMASPQVSRNLASISVGGRNNSCAATLAFGWRVSVSTSHTLPPSTMGLSGQYPHVPSAPGSAQLRYHFSHSDSTMPCSILICSGVEASLPLLSFFAASSSNPSIAPAAV